MNEKDWLWMPHAGHLIVGNDCRFHLNTYVGEYIVSTVGEWWPDRRVREIHAHVHDPKWFLENKQLMGDSFDHAYLKKFGFEEIGSDWTYETMVFKAKKGKDDKCCPWRMVSGELDFEGYKMPEAALKGHYKMCKKWSKK